GNHWCKLDLIQDIAMSNDAGNVFGFKLTSREANFGDFGTQEFMDNQGLCMGGDNAACNNMYTTPPNDLNYPGKRNFFQTKLKYEIPLFTGFQITSYTEIMEAMSKMKNLDKTKVINEKVYQLRKSYYDMALLQNSTKNLNKILTNIETLEDMTNQMIEVGYAKKVDLLEVQAKKGKVERLVLEMQSNQQLLYHYISFLLNKKIQNISVPTQDVKMPIFSDEDILRNNIDIQRASTGLEVRKGMLGVSKSSYYPMVGAFAEIATADDSFLGEANDHKAYTVGARLTWNLFNGGIDSAKVEQSRIEHLKTQTQVALAKKGITLKVDKIRTEIKTYDAEIDSLQKELKLANAIYENYEGRYREKLVSMSDVIIKQSQQIQKILELQMAHNKRNERIFALEKLANGENK
ncbi:MAG: TolC family protein, partial [Epsilonproteobacteria bacterium]|nr:TolC family protein [Campylobacterota bacterium]